MCLFVIKHWLPCLHLRALCVEVCGYYFASPGLEACECPFRRDVLLEREEGGGCPVCAWGEEGDEVYGDDEWDVGEIWDDGDEEDEEDELDEMQEGRGFS